MSNPEKTFACAINCMDGRVQEAVIAFMRNAFGVDYVDMVTEPGPNKILAENTDHALVESIRRRVALSVQIHHSSVVAIVAHPHCGGNPADQPQQIKDLYNARWVLEGFGLDVKIVLLWVCDDWKTVTWFN